MTTTAVSPPALPAAAPRGLRIFVIIIAAIETLSGFSDLPALSDLPAPGPGFVVAQYAGNAYLVAHPLLAIAALALAVLRRPRHAIMAVSLLVLANWLSDLPAVFVHGLEIEPGLFGKLTAIKTLGYPVIGGLALSLAWRGTHLWPAALLVAVPTLAALAGVLGFAIGVAIYGF